MGNLWRYFQKVVCIVFWGGSISCGFFVTQWNLWDLIDCIDPDPMIQRIGQTEGDLLGNRINEVSHSARFLSHFIPSFSLFVLLSSLSLRLCLCSLIGNRLWLSTVNCLQLWVNRAGVKLPRGKLCGSESTGGRLSSSTLLRTGRCCYDLHRSVCGVLLDPSKTVDQHMFLLV